MRIFYLSWNFPPTLGGIEYVAGHLYEGLKKSGNEVHLLTRFNLKIHFRTKPPKANFFGILLFWIFAFFRGFVMIKKNKSQVILCPSVTAAPIAWLLSRIFSLPYVVLIHGSDLLRQGWLYQRIVRIVLKRARLIFANSQQTKKIFLDQGYSKVPVEVVYPGISCKDFLVDPIDTRKKPATPPTLLFVGRLVKRKGLFEFVSEVMPKLAQNFNGIKFLIVGDDPQESLVHHEHLKEKINKKIQELDLSQNVELLGSVSDQNLHEIYHKADLFILPCLNIQDDIEGFGIVFLEAAMANTPSIATRVGGIPEAVLHEETGLLNETEDHEGIYQSISRLLSDATLHQKLTHQAKIRVQNEFDWPLIIQQYQSGLEKCLTP